MVEPGNARADRAADTAQENMPKKSVTFGPAETAGKAGHRQSGLKKGFLDTPKPVLKKASSIREPMLPSQASPAVLASEQQGWEEGREAAFSGRVVERDAGATMQPVMEEERMPTPANGHAQAALPVKRVSRFKQQRGGMG